MLFTYLRCKTAFNFCVTKGLPVHLIILNHLSFLLHLHHCDFFPPQHLDSSLRGHIKYAITAFLLESVWTDCSQIQMPELAAIWLKVVQWCKCNSICKNANAHICTNKPLLSFPPRYPGQAGNLSGSWRGEQKASSRLMMTAAQKALVFSEGGCII